MHKNIKNIEDKIQSIFSERYEIIKNIELFHEGYVANSYYVRTETEEFLAKVFNISGDAKLEADAIEKLSSVFSEHIKILDIVAKIDNVIIVRYERGIKFYPGIISGLKNKKSEQILFEFGSYLSLFHNKYFKGYDSDKNPMTFLHGDISSKNILFLKNGNLFLFDPRGVIGNIYDELAEFIFNFYPMNFFYEIKIKKTKNKLIKSFLRGYESFSKIEIEEDKLNKSMIKIISQEKRYLSKKISYVIKKVFINIYLNYLIKGFLYDKIRIKIHR